jgi:hypothetical protein
MSQHSPEVMAFCREALKIRFGVDVLNWTALLKQ